MNRLLLFVIAGTLGFAGCKRAQESNSPAPEEVKLFEKGKGLRLPPQTCQMLGLETVEAAEKPFRRALEVSAQVYESGGARPVRAMATLSAEQAKNFEPGGIVTLAPFESGGNSVTGKLVRLVPLGTQAEALLEFPDPNQRMAVGSFLRATITAAKPHTSLAVPESSIVHGAEGAFVYTVNGEHFTRTPVKVGATADGFTEILDGLYAGDAVATKATEPMWMIELYALKGGIPCCPVPKKNTAN